MKTSLRMTLIALLLCGAAIACNAQTNVDLKLKHRSTFTCDAAHNPFWPIGWVKNGTESETQDVAVPITADKFQVTSISTGATPMAVINGKTYAEGETIIALYSGQKIKILVASVTDGTVVLQYLDKKYTVPLKR